MFDLGIQHQHHNTYYTFVLYTKAKTSFKEKEEEEEEQQQQ